MAETVKERKPMWVHCAACSHEWICAYLPMPIPKLAPLMKAPCPMCGGKKVLNGKIPRETPDGDAIGWLTNGDTGMSSMTIWTVMMGKGRPRDDGYSVPHDPDDFGRCYRLLKVMPSWRERLPEVAAKAPRWKKLVERWDEIEASYLRELPTGLARKTYDMIQECIGR